MRPVVIVPTYNERANIAVLMPALLEIDGLRVLVVDDDSPDGTGAEADDLARASGGRVSVIHRSGRRGYGRSHLEGMRAALQTDATHICQMDADLSHDPADLRRMLDAATQADLVVGSRYVQGGRVVNWPRRRRALSAFANWYVRVITGVGISDCTSGFRCWSRPLLTALDLSDVRSDGYAFLVELAWKARRARGRILEVPITFVERREGASKLSWAVIGESVVLPWRLVARREPEAGSRKPDARSDTFPVLVTSPRPSITAFFPCYNDERTIGTLVRRAAEQLALVADDFEILVVNDGSQDGSAEVLDSLAREMPCLKVITHPANRGYGGALRSGFSNATKDLVFYTDGDGQYDVGELPLLLMLLTPDTDFVNGMKMTRQDPGYRVFAGNLHRFVMRWSFWLPITDVDCDFRLVRRSIVDRVRLTKNSGSICVELVKLAHRAGAQFREVSVHHYARAFGQSQFFRPGRIAKTYLDLARLWVELMIVARFRG